MEEGKIIKENMTPAKSGQELRRKKLFLLDMDGTLYLGDCLFDGSRELIDHIRSVGKPVFMTNNSSRGVDSYIRKMKKLGIETQKDDYLTSVDCLIERLEKEDRDGIFQRKMSYGNSANSRNIYVMGTESMKAQMEEAGLSVADALTETGKPDSHTGTRMSDLDSVGMVVIGYDTELNYRKLEEVSYILTKKKDIPYLATNMDWVCPTEYGFVPDCGSFAEMIQRATGRMPDFIGKPAPDMALLALKKYGCKKEEALLIGDRLYTDIKCGNNAGIDTLFVLSGEGTMDDLKNSDASPDYIMSGVRELLEKLYGRKKGGERK